MQYTVKYGANLNFEDEEKPQATNEIMRLTRRPPYQIHGRHFLLIMQSGKDTGQ